MKYNTFNKFLENCKYQIERNADFPEEDDDEEFEPIPLQEDNSKNFDRAIDGLFEIFDVFLGQIVSTASYILTKDFSEFFGPNDYAKLNGKTVEVKMLMDKFNDWTNVFNQANSNIKNLEGILDDRIEYVFKTENRWTDVPNTLCFSIAKDSEEDLPDEFFETSKEEIKNIANIVFEGTNVNVEIKPGPRDEQIAVVSLKG